MSRDQMNRIAIQAREVCKTYKGGTKALSCVDLDVCCGEVICFAGPNGAGKTTLVRILATQLMPTAGKVRIFGVDIVRHPEKVRASLGVVPQEARPDPDRSPLHHLYYYGRARGLARREAQQRTEEVLRLLDLWEWRERPARELSGGLRQRVLIAMVMVTKAPLLFLDEPTTGLDPVARRELWRILGGIRDQSTVVLTTHYMEEAEVLADRVVILLGGKILAAASPRKLVATLPYRSKVLLEDRPDEVSKETLSQYGRMEELAGRYVLYLCEHETDSLHRVVDILAAHKLRFSVAPLTLEDYYIMAVGGAA